MPKKGLWWIRNLRPLTVPGNYQGTVGAFQFCFEKDQPEWIFDLGSESFLQLQPKTDVVLSLDLVQMTAQDSCARAYKGFHC